MVPNTARERARLVMREHMWSSEMVLAVAAGLVLTAKVDDAGRLVSQATVAKLAGLTRLAPASVQQCRNLLQKKGAITVEHCGPKTGIVVFQEKG